MLKLISLLLTNIHQAVIEIIFPEFCVGCSKLDTLLCNRCFEKLEQLQFSINKDKKCPNLDSITCGFSYDSLSKNIISEFKYMGVINVGKLIAHLIYYTCYLPNFDVITFVPIHIKKKKQRGFNQTEIMAIELAKLTNKPVAELLIKTKPTKSQMSLKQKISRQENLMGTIAINPAVEQADSINIFSILLVDDVFTSGTTLNYCASILKDFGFKIVHGVCFLHKS
jgi:competence protein ComFC